MPDYSLGLYEKAMPNHLTLEEKLVETKKAGFDFLEISIDESEEKLARLKWSQEQRLELVKKMSSTETAILTMCLSGHRRFPLGSESEDTQKRSLEIMSDAVKLAVDLGVRLIQLAGYDEYYKPSTAKTQEIFWKNLQICIKLAAKQGVILAFETMETDFMNTIGKARHYVTRAGSPYLQIYPDLGNITNAANGDTQKVVQDLKTGQGHIAAIHLKESLPGKFREVPFGTGHVDFPTAIGTARRLGVGLYVAEFWHTGQPNWQEDLSKTNKFFRNIFEETNWKEKTHA